VDLGPIAMLVNLIESGNLTCISKTGALMPKFVVNNVVNLSDNSRYCMFF